MIHGHLATVKHLKLLGVVKGLLSLLFGFAFLFECAFGSLSDAADDLRHLWFKNSTSLFIVDKVQTDKFHEYTTTCKFSGATQGESRLVCLRNYTTTPTRKALKHSHTNKGDKLKENKTKYLIKILGHYEPPEQRVVTDFTTLWKCRRINKILPKAIHSVSVLLHYITCI